MIKLDFREEVSGGGPLCHQEVFQSGVVGGSEVRWWGVGEKGEAHSAVLRLPLALPLSVLLYTRNV